MRTLHYFDKVRKRQAVNFDSLPGILPVSYTHLDVYKRQIVDLLPKDAPPELVTHKGQEFNYVLEGKVTVLFGDHKFVLNEGDSIYFDPKVPHGQMAEYGFARFLTIINE